SNTAGRRSVLSRSTSEISLTSKGMASASFSSGHMARVPGILGGRRGRASRWGRSGVLIMPRHSPRIIQVRGDQASLARAYLRTEGPATVCLHSEDIHKPDIVGSWLDAGHRVVTAGPRHDPDFLSRILALVLASERVVANRLMTPVLYAASVGKHQCEDPREKV